MGRLSKKLLVVFAAVTLIGSCLHFVYAIFSNPVTALFSPVNESLWEHLKILFWPYLVGALVVTRHGEKGCRAPWMLSAIVLCAVMLGVGYLYHIVLFGEHLIVDVILYVLLMAVGFFLLPGLFCGVAARPGTREALTLAMVVLAGMIILFTFLPPDNVFFVDLSGVNTFAVNPRC